MELSARSRRSLRKPCKLSDYVTSNVAANMSFRTIGRQQEQQQQQGDCINKENENVDPKTPPSPKNRNLQTKTPITNPFIARIQHDLNSPSASVRLRAMKALRSPTKSAYVHFDVSHNEKSIITAEEREVAAKKPPTLQEIFKDVVIYVEVRTDDDDRSAGVKKVVEGLGLQVNDTLKQNTTHVVFKDGRLSTFKKAKVLGIPIVSILWIEACRNHCRLCDPKDFPISNLDRYENPELYGKMKRYKFMQPGSEDKKRRPRKQTVQPTPPPNGNYSQTDIGRFFKTLNKTATKTVKSASSSVDSPATIYIKRITTITSKAAQSSEPNNALEETKKTNTKDNDTPVTAKSCNSSVRDEATVANTTDSMAQMSLTPLTTHSSRLLDSSYSSTKLTDHLNNANSTNKNKQRCRTILPLANSTRLSDLIETNCNESANALKVVMNEELFVNMEGTKTEVKTTMDTFTVTSTVRRHTTLNAVPMEITQMVQNEIETTMTTTPVTAANNKQRRRTLFTPLAIAECTKTNEKQEINANATNEDHNDETIVEAIPIVTTPNNFKGGASEAAATISAVRHVCRRRTIFDIDMDLITYQVQNMNAKSRKSMLMASETPQRRVSSSPLPKTTTLEETARNERNEHQPPKTITTPSGEVNTPAAARDIKNHQVQAAAAMSSEIAAATPNTNENIANEVNSNNNNTTVEKKKRKLFRPLESSPFSTPPLTPLKANKPSRESSSSAAKSSSSTTKVATKRRRTFIPVQSNVEPLNASSLIVDATTPAHQTTSSLKKMQSKVALLSRRSTMDFEPPKSTTRRTPSQNSLKENDANSINGTQQLSTAANSRSIIPAKRRLPYLAFTNMRTGQVAEIHEAVEKFGGFVIEHVVGTNTTHMVSFEARRTMNLLRGLVRGVWILDFNWIKDSLKAGQWQKEEPYEMKDFSRAVEICRAERQAFGQHYKCELFADCGTFFISSRCDNIPARDLKELIRLCGGTVVDQRKDAKYVLSSSTRAVDNKIYVTPLWILDSITKMQLLRIQKYSAGTQLPTRHTTSNTRNMPTAIDM